MDEELLEYAAAILDRGDSLTMDALAAEAEVSRSTAYRRTGGTAAVLEVLRSRGIGGADTLTSRDKLLDAVRAVVARQGLVGVSIESLAAEAGVSPMTVYRLFGDRETLLREALDDVFPSPQLEGLADMDAPLAEVLELVAVSMVRFAGSYPGLMALMLAPASRERAELMRLYGMQLDMRARLVELFEAHAAAGAIPPGDALARTGDFSGLCLGASLLLHEIRPLRDDDVESRARRVVRTFLATLHDG